MVCRAIRDTYGTLYRIPKSNTVKTPGGVMLPGYSHVDVWWDRDHAKKANESLLIRQDNDEKRADVIEIALGQVYDMIHALGWAVLKP